MVTLRTEPSISILVEHQILLTITNKDVSDNKTYPTEF